MPHVSTNRLIVLTLVIVSLISLAGRSATAEVTFYFQRHGSPDDDGQARFVAALTDPIEEDFEDPVATPPGGAMQSLSFGAFQLQLAGEWYGPYAPTVLSSSEFNVPGRVDVHALAVGHTLTVTPDDQTLLLAQGMWIFDDGRAYDSVYQVEVTETDGSTWQAILENEIGLGARGHEIEGFVGAVSDIGIASMRIRAVDPVTGAAQTDMFEVDHWIIAAEVPAWEDLPENHATARRFRFKEKHYDGDLLKRPQARRARPQQKRLERRNRRRADHRPVRRGHRRPRRAVHDSPGDHHAR